MPSLEEPGLGLGRGQGICGGCLGKALASGVSHRVPVPSNKSWAALCLSLPLCETGMVTVSTS